MKRLICFTLMVFLSFAIAGCSEKQEVQEPQKEIEPVGANQAVDDSNELSNRFMEEGVKTEDGMLVMTANEFEKVFFPLFGEKDKKFDTFTKEGSSLNTVELKDGVVLNMVCDESTGHIKLIRLSTNDDGDLSAQTKFMTYIMAMMIVIDPQTPYDTLFSSTDGEGIEEYWRGNKGTVYYSYEVEDNIANFDIIPM